jgi:hypothetical protein
MATRPGLVVLFGSGESLPDAQPIHDAILRTVTPPVKVCIIETPAGFEMNSPQVAGRLGEYLKVRLQNYRPEITVVAARRRGTAFSPDDPAIVEPLFRANFLMMGPGSPSYAVRQLRDSLTWYACLARHRLGYPIVLASAATVAVSDYALPVYEIYKVGEDLHWKRGLNLFGPNGVSVAFVPHWDNNDGGDELDTSRCFMSRDRFEKLRGLLPSDTVVIGIDERTALVLDFAAGEARVMGAGGVTWQAATGERRFGRRETFPLAELGIGQLTDVATGIPEAVWEKARAATQAPESAIQSPPPDVVAIVTRRAEARANKDWAASDRLREEIAHLGWKIKDTPAGAELLPLTGPTN